MLSIGAVASASAGAAYFNKDDYYTRDADSPSAWYGVGADALGLDGGVDKATFEALLDGVLPGQDKRLGFERDGVWVHRAGWDLTFSAPKSVSLMAEVAGDRRIIAAHDAAVRATLDALQKDHAATQLKRDGFVTREATGNLVAALFRHDLSRNQDPQLHTHAVIANATLTARGWRSIDSKPFYEAQMEIGLRYRQELALRVQRLGYAIDIGRNGMFEIRGVSREAMTAFSTRRQEIDAKLRQMGVAPGQASPAESAAATLATRRSKATADRDALAQSWREQLGPAQREALDGLRDGAVQRESTAARTHDAGARATAAAAVLKDAIAALSERDAAFSIDRLKATAARIGVGRVTDADIDGALQAALKRGDAIGRSVVEADRLAQIDLAKDGLTTEKLRAAERAMIASEAQGRDSVKRLASPALASRAINTAVEASRHAGHYWTEDQRRATATLLTSRDTVTAVQGLAGTAKTTTVLATYAKEAERLGKDVRAMAPTASAAETLGAALKLPGKTVDRHLMELRLGRGQAVQNRWGRREQVWIVDEASLLATEKMRALLAAAQKEGARIVMVGDARQLGSVEAGAAFRQLQEAGMRTAVLDHIVRQTDPALRTAVDQAAGGRGAASMGYFDADPARMIVKDDPDARRAALAERWLALSPAERDKTILIEPSRIGRTRINEAIRAGLIAEGRLGGEGLATARLEAKGLANVEKRFVHSYEVGDRVLFQRAYKVGSQTLEANVHHVVAGVRQGDGVVTLRTPRGADIDWKPAQKGAAKSEVYQHQRAELRVGDAVTWTRNDPKLGLRNGLPGVVTALDAKSGDATIAFANGRAHVVSKRKDDDKHWRHAYAQTAYAAQGRTAERVLIHAESTRINLINSSSFYVALSRAKAQGTLATDDPAKLKAALDGRAGRKETALDARESAAVAAATDSRGLSTGARLTESLSESLRALRAGVSLSADKSETRFEPRRMAEPTRDLAAQSRDRDAAKAASRDRAARTPERADSLAGIKRDAEKAAKQDAARTKTAQTIRGLER